MFGLGAVTGQVRLRAGHIVVASSITPSTVHAVAAATSFDSGHPTRDRMVHSGTYLDTATYPDLEFVADRVENSAGAWQVFGTLTARGVSAPLQLTVGAVEVDGDEVRAHATAQVDRYAHRITAGRGVAGRRLEIEIDAVAVAG
jgi:polyisoprenoid-binding protein YceI